MNDNKALAIWLHKEFCQHNHTDDCMWYYEMTAAGDHSWSMSDHVNWLEKAAKVRAQVNGT